MNHLTKNERSTLLAAYLDHELDEGQARAVEEWAARDASIQTELDELRSLKKLLASKKPIPPSIGFWTRLSTELESRKKDEENLLPFPRKYVPAVGTAAAVLVLAVGVLLYQQRESLVDYVSQQSERVQRVVTDNVLKGSILPLFSNVDKNQALQFAMFGTIALDARAETELKVDEDSAKWCTINVNKGGVPKSPPVTVADFVDEVRPTRGQLEIIDSLLDLGRRKLEGSVFVAEDKGMAVHPEISRLNRVMLSGIAAALDPEQRVRFNQFLRDKRAPYALVGGQREPASMDRILYTLRSPQKSDRFVVVTPETVMVAGLHVDIDSVRMHYTQVKQAQHNMAVQVDCLIRRIAEREAGISHRYVAPTTQVRVFGDSETFTIQIGAGVEGVRIPGPETWVRQRTMVTGGLPRSPRLRSFNFNFSSDDTALFISLDLDSLMMNLGKDAQGATLDMLRADPRLRNRVTDFDPSRYPHVTDSAVLALKRKQWSKLDSLMREMDKKEQLMQKQQREQEKKRREEN